MTASSFEAIASKLGGPYVRRRPKAEKMIEIELLAFANACAIPALDDV